MLKFRPGYRLKLSLFVALLLPVLLKLGFWQVSRYEEKLALEQSLKQRLDLDALTLAEVSEYSDPMYLPVKVTGRFVEDRYFLHDNQVFQGQAGYDLLMPFVTGNGNWLLVNRGWLASGFRNEWPEITSPKGVLKITGSLYRQLGESFTLGQDYWGDDWPKRIQTVDFEKVSNALEKKLPDYIVKLDEYEPGAFQYRSQEFRTSSQKHLGYAVQWFLMALVLLGLYLWQMNSHSRQNKHLKEECP